MDRFAALWRDQDPGRLPRETMAHWLEILVKYRNLDHLLIQDKHLNLLQYFSVDVIAFLLAISAVCSALVFLLARALCTLLMSTAAARIRLEEARVKSE